MNVGELKEILKQFKDEDNVSIHVLCKPPGDEVERWVNLYDVEAIKTYEGLNLQPKGIQTPRELDFSRFKSLSYYIRRLREFEKEELEDVK